MYFSTASLNKDTHRIYPNKDVNKFDIIFNHELDNQIQLVVNAYDKMLFRDVLRHGFH